MIRLVLTLAVLSTPAQAEVIDRACMLVQLCPMAATCIPQEQPITVRIDTDSGTARFGLNGRATDLTVQSFADGLLVARSTVPDRVENALLSVFPDGTLAYTVHLVNEMGTGMGLSAYGTCQPAEDK